MRKAFVSSAAVAVALLLSWADVHACGDKFLVVGRGVRYQRVRPAVHPASILIYMNPSSHVPAAAKDLMLESGLKQAGHKVQTVKDSAGLEDALKAGKYDLVVADIVDSPGVEKDLGSQPGKPLVVPVLYNPTADQLASAEKKYGCAMKAPSKDYLLAIDEAMTQRLKGTEAKAGKAQ